MNKSKHSVTPLLCKYLLNCTKVMMIAKFLLVFNEIFASLAGIFTQATCADPRAHSSCPDWDDANFLVGVSWCWSLLFAVCAPRKLHSQLAHNRAAGGYCAARHQKQSDKTLCVCMYYLHVNAKAVCESAKLGAASALA